MPTCNGHKPMTIILQGAYFLPSVSCLNCAGCSILIKDRACVLHGAHSQCLFLSSVPQIHGLYQLNASALINPPKLHANVTTPSMDINKLHRKLSHLNFHTLQEMVSKGTVSGLAIDSNSKSNFCILCIKGKASYLPFPKESKTTYTKYDEKIVTDLWGLHKLYPWVERTMPHSIMIWQQAKTM